MTPAITQTRTWTQVKALLRVLSLGWDYVFALPFVYVGWIYWLGISIVTILLAWEYSLMRSADFGKLGDRGDPQDLTIFNLSSCISLTLLLAVAGAMVFNS